MPKSLQDLVRGIRNTGHENEVNYITQALVDIHTECKSKKTSDKVEAIQKLTFLYLLGYDIRPYAFNTIECISSQEPLQKRVGYLASNFSFGSPDMQTLSTNLYVVDIKNKSVQVKMMALSSLASCPAPNREQVHTLIPILYEQLQQQGQNLSNAPLLIKLIATTLRLLVLAKRKEIEGTAEFVPDFIEILFNLASSGNLTKDVVLTQVYCHCSLEVARNFSYEFVMKLLPSLHDIMVTAKQPWILIEVCRFFGFMALQDDRIKQKVREQFSMLLGATESKSLLMELAKATAEGFYNDGEMVAMATRRLAELILPNQTRTDANLKTLAIRNLAILEKASPGIISRIDGLVNHLILILDDKDYNLRISVLDAISSLANQQYLENIVNKLLQSLKQTKQMSKGTSIKDLHQISASDIQVFKRRVVTVIFEMCCRDNYANVTNPKWFIDVLITLSMEYPQLSADDCAVRLLDLCLKSDQLRCDAPSLVSIILSNKVFVDMAGINIFDQTNVNNVTLSGPVVNQQLFDIQKEIELFNKLLICKYGSNQIQTRDITDAIYRQYKADPRLAQMPIFKYFSKEFFKMMEDNLSIEKKQFTQDRVFITINSRIIQSEEFRQYQSISSLLQISAYVLGTFLCYQPAGADAINIYTAVDLLLNKQIKAFSIDTMLVYVTAAFKAFITLFYTYVSNNMFTDQNTTQQFVNDSYYQDFVITKLLTQDQIQDEQKRLEQERDMRVSNIDQTFLSDREKEQLFYIPEVQEVKVLALDSLVHIFVKSFDLLMQKLKEFSLIPELHTTCNLLYYLAKNQAKVIEEQVKKVETEHLKEELSKIITKYINTEQPPLKEGLIEPTLENVATGLLQVNQNDLLFEQKYVQRPEFSFENGSFFSLDNNEGCLQQEYDFMTYQFEEYTNQKYKEKKRRHVQEQQEQSDQKQDAFQQFVTEQIEEPSIQQEPIESYTPKQDQMSSAFGAPTVKSAFYIDKNKLNKVETKVQIGKYTSGLRIGGGQQNAFGIKPTIQVQKPSDEGKKKRRKHGDLNQEDQNEQVAKVVQEEVIQEQVVQEVIQEQVVEKVEEVVQIEQVEQVQQKQEQPTDDLASLFM